MTRELENNTRPPKAIGDILAELMARRGYARRQAHEAFQDAWREATGDMIAQYSRAGRVRRGQLDVAVANSTLLHELTFQKQTILARLAELLPQERISDLRFRVTRIT